MTLNHTYNKTCQLNSEPAALHITKTQTISVMKFQWNHKGLVMHMYVAVNCVSGKWLGTKQTPSHYLNWCSLLVNWTFQNKFQWKFNQNSNNFLKECFWKCLQNIGYFDELKYGHENYWVPMIMGINKIYKIFNLPHKYSFKSLPESPLTIIL